MAVGANTTTLDAEFKQFYANGIEDLCFTDRALSGLLPKVSLEGANQTTRAFHIPMKFALPPAVSGDFAVAQARAATVSSKVSAWELTTKSMYAFIQLDNESVERSVGKEAAFVEMKSLEVNGVIENFANRLHHYAYGDGTAVIAQVGNSTQMPSFATSVLYLLNSEDCVKVAYGDELAVAATATGSYRAFGSNSHGLYVIGTNFDLGTVTVGTAAGTAVNLSDAADGIPTIANSDYIFHRGDGAGGKAVIAGFQSWCPSYATGVSSSDSQYNVNRSLNVDFLAGSRLDGSSMGIEDALLRATNIVAKKGGKIEEFFINHKHFTDLVAAISARGTVNMLEIRPEEYPDIGFQGVTIQGAKGPVDVIPDYACPSTLAAGMRISEWFFGSVGELIHTSGGDGLEFLRLSSSDGLEGRFASYSNICPRNPRDAINVTLAQ